MTERIELRIYGAPALPTLIYLPGLHGDWTLVGGFRRALGAGVRFVEVTYPRTLAWSLDEYAAALEAELREHGITRGWLLGESFSSQVAWQAVARKRFEIQGVILAGGFARHPVPWGPGLAETLLRRAPPWLLAWVISGYARLARLRYRRSPEVLAGLQDFIARRTSQDWAAARHRLRLIAGFDPRTIARTLSIPLYAVTGVLDPIVPWFWVRPWLRRQCPALAGFKIIWRADHNVLATAPRAAAETILGWMGIYSRPSILRAAR